MAFGGPFQLMILWTEQTLLSLSEGTVKYCSAQGVQELRKGKQTASAMYSISIHKEVCIAAAWMLRLKESIP